MHYYYRTQWWYYCWYYSCCTYSLSSVYTAINLSWDQILQEKEAVWDIVVNVIAVTYLRTYFFSAKKIQCAQRGPDCDIVTAIKQFGSSNSKRRETAEEIEGDYDDDANSEINVRKETPLD